MTALAGPILFNNSTGSDTDASGLGPSARVILSCPLNNGSTSSSYSVLSGNINDVQAGHLAYVGASASIRRFSVVASVDTFLNQITFDEAFDESSPGSLNGFVYIAVHIGGKRKTIDDTNSRRIFAHDVDQASGYDIEIEYTGTDYNLSSVLLVASVDSIKGTGSQKPVISTSYNNDTVWEIAPSGTARLSSAQLNPYVWENIRFESSVNRTSGDRSLISNLTGSLSSSFTYRECVFDGQNSEYIFRTMGNPAQENYNIEKCDFINLKPTGFSIGLYNENARIVSVRGSRFAGSGNSGSFGMVGAIGSVDVALSCVFDDLGHGILGNNSGSLCCAIGCVFYSCDTGVSRTTGGVLVGNIFHSNTNAITSTAGGAVVQNGMYNNTGSLLSGTEYNFSNDPLSDPANDDFSLSSSGQSEIASISPAFGTPVSGGIPALPFYGLNVMLDPSGGASGGIFKVTMNGGMDG